MRDRFAPTRFVLGLSLTGLHLLIVAHYCLLNDYPAYDDRGIFLFGLGLVLGVVGILALLTSVYLHHSGQSRRQQEANLRGSLFEKSVRTGSTLSEDELSILMEGRDFSGLYLLLRPIERRPNLLRNPFYERHGIRLLGPLPDFLEPAVTDYVTLLVRSLEHRGSTVLAIGGAPSTLGPPKVEARDEEWIGKFVSLSRRARAVLILPAKSPGLILEVSLLRSRGMLSKCVFLMPPALAVGFSAGFEVVDGWVETQTYFRKIGLQLPDYYAFGMLFGLRGDGSVGVTKRLDADSYSKDFGLHIDLFESTARSTDSEG